MRQCTYRVVAHGQLDATLAEVAGKERVFLLFSGTTDAAGKSWCPDCSRALPVIKTAVQQFATEADAFVYVDVGDRNEWKTPSHPLRTRFQLTGVPTLLVYNTSQRLVEDQCLDEAKLALLFEDD